MSINAVLFNLQERLNLLNIQLVAARYVGGSPIGKLSKRIHGLQSRVDSCRSRLQANLQRLEEAKTFCVQVLAGAEECSSKTAVGKASSTSNPPTIIHVPSEIPAITLEEFETVPKYMRGRLTREKVNGGVEFLNRVLLDKYTFLRQNPTKLPPDQRQKYYDWKDCEMEETLGKFFVTETDVKAALGAKGGTGLSSATFKLDSTGRAILAIMRHCGRIKEVRGNGMTRFVVQQ